VCVCVCVCVCVWIDVMCWGWDGIMLCLFDGENGEDEDEEGGRVMEENTRLDGFD
jgi:hypothetical protein